MNGVSPGSERGPEILYISGLMVVVPTLWWPERQMFSETEMTGSISGPAPQLLEWVEARVTELITEMMRLFPGMDWRQAVIKCQGSPPLVYAIERFYHYQFMEGKIHA